MLTNTFHTTCTICIICLSLHCIVYDTIRAGSSGAAGGSLGGRSIDEEEALATASLSTTASQHLEPLECTFTGECSFTISLRKPYCLIGCW